MIEVKRIEQRYKWAGMRIVSWKEIKKIAKKEGNLAGYYYLFDDNTEKVITPFDSWVDIVEHYENGGQFGAEMREVTLRLPDGKEIVTPECIDISDAESLDNLEWSMWGVIEEYLQAFGIRTKNKNPDWATVKMMQDKLLDILVDAGVNIKIFTDRQQVEMDLILKTERS